MLRYIGRLEQVLVGILVAVIVLDILALLGVAIGFIALKRVKGVADVAEAALKDIRQEVPPTLRASQDTLYAVQNLTMQAEQELQRVDQVVQSVDRLLTGAALTDVAVKAVKGSRGTLGDVIAAVKEGLKVLRSPSEGKKE
jgi:uncharacterized protein YoxC